MQKELAELHSEEGDSQGRHNEVRARELLRVVPTIGAYRGLCTNELARNLRFVYIFADGVQNNVCVNEGLCGHTTRRD